MGRYQKELNDPYSPTARGATMQVKLTHHFLHFLVVKHQQNANQADANSETLGKSKYPDLGKSGIWNSAFRIFSNSFYMTFMICELSNYLPNAVQYLIIDIFFIPEFGKILANLECE